jgi:hypothetical protein
MSSQLLDLLTNAQSGLRLLLDAQFVLEPFVTVLPMAFIKREGRYKKSELSRVLMLEFIYAEKPYEASFSSRVLGQLDECFGDPLRTAAALTGTDFRRAFFNQHITDARGLLAEIRSLPEQSRVWLEASDVASDVKELLFGPLTPIALCIVAMENICELLSLSTRHPFVRTGYSLSLPTRQLQRIISPLDQIIIEASTNPGLINRLTPRDFERFIATIWSAFGFKVELTAQTRDGGSDIVCIRNELGVPFKIAIEVKRYREDRPISVELVRAFVGANATIAANKLVYVTTSRYTRDAMEYARSATVAHLLELKALPDIMRWADEFRELRSPVK